ncbi:oxidase/peroxidase [Anopheles darlingi]|uniref:Oxidase/peroxidase n=2 Tax=Anopheles darlingi TaxID=43151 RepID=W5JKR5_ANODA|nr:oxidase/peroxidase [Anopheles darlingi]
MVPFVLLTNIDRPDNWIMYHSKPSKRRTPPPAVPLLKSDTFSLSELPKPIIGPD